MNSKSKNISEMLKVFFANPAFSLLIELSAKLPTGKDGV